MTPSNTNGALMPLRVGLQTISTIRGRLTLLGFLWRAFIFDTESLIDRAA